MSFFRVDLFPAETCSRAGADPGNLASMTSSMAYSLSDLSPLTSFTELRRVGGVLAGTASVQHQYAIAARPARPCLSPPDSVTTGRRADAVAGTTSRRWREGRARLWFRICYLYPPQHHRRPCRRRSRRRGGSRPSRRGSPAAPRAPPH